MGGLVKHILWIVFLSLFFVAASAQGEQLEFLPSMHELTEKDRAVAGVLKEYSNHFHKAQIYNRPDDFLLTIEYKNEVQSWTEDITLQRGEWEELRANLSAALVDIPDYPVKERNDKSRIYLVTSATLHAFAQGRILSNLVNRQLVREGIQGTYIYEERTHIGKTIPYPAATGALIGTLLWSNNKSIQLSAANMHFWGSLFGYGHGILLSSLLREPYARNNNTHLESIMISGTSLFEGWIGYHIANRHKFSYVRSKAINTGNFWGTVTGLMAYGVFNRDSEFQYNNFGIYGLMGAGLGVITSNSLFKRYPRTTGDLMAINSGGVVGASWGLTLSLVFDFNRRDSYTSLFAGTLSGLAIPAFSTKNTNFTKLQGTILTLGTLAGGLLGAATTVALNGDPLFYSSAISIGLSAGLLFTPQFFVDSGTKNSSSGIDRNINWSVNPASIGMVLSSPDQQANLMMQNIRMDMVSISYSF